jgi:hypothetical protein
MNSRAKGFPRDPSQRIPKFVRGRLLQIYFVELLVFVLLVDVLDGVLEDQKIRAVLAVDLNAALVVPLEDPSNFFPIEEFDDEWGLRRHLLDVVIILGVCDLGRHTFARSRTSVARYLIFDVRETRPYQFTINHENFLQGRQSDFGIP